MEPSRIVVLGGINMDLVATVERFPVPGETVVGRAFTTYSGGKGANQAVAAARLGAQVRMVGRVGDDAFGHQLRHGLAIEGIDVEGVGVESGSASGIAVIQIDGSAQNQIVQVWGANQSCGEEEVERVETALAGASVLMLQLEAPVEVSLKAARAARAHGCQVVLDPAPAPAGGLPQDFYGLCDCITPNETEAQGLVGFAISDTDSAHRAAEELLKRGAKAAVIKMGERGAYYLAEGEGGQVPAFPVKAVDTVAAGDAFNAGLAVALAEGRALGEAVRWGAAAGAVAVTRTGAQDAMPRRDEVEGLLRGVG